jgi:membrane associated rhomboid family serine protease
MKNSMHPFGSWREAFFYSFLVLAAMWLVFWAEYLFSYKFHELGVRPRTLEGLKGVVLMPLIHSERDFHHIFNNSLPIFLLLSTLIYFYRDIAWKIFSIGWLMTGFAIWLYAENKGAYHIGMSGIIYLLAGFLFFSGVFRKFLPLQAISLFVVFLYGSMVWGIFPLEEKVSWEGHLMGLVVGIVFAYFFRKEGPQRPKYQYEIEREMGIEPPDWEAIYNEKVRLAREAEEAANQDKTPEIIYHYTPSEEKNNPSTR